MRALVMLLCFGSVLSFSAYNPLNQNERSHGEDPFEGLLTGLSEEALSEYYEIFQNMSQTLEQLETSLERWAIKYGVEAKYRALVAQFEKEKTELVRSLTELSHKLTTFIKEFVKLGGDKKQTIKSVFWDSEELYNTLDEKQKAIISHIFQIYSPNIESNSVISRSTGFPGSYRRFIGNNGVLIGRKEGFQVNKGAFSKRKGGSRGNNREFIDNIRGFPERNEEFVWNQGVIPCTKGGIRGDKQDFSEKSGLPRNNIG